MQNNITRIAIMVGLILLIPLFGNFYIEGCNWGVGDFIFMGGLMFGTGLALDFMIRNITKLTYRIFACIVVIFLFLAVWVELAVDGISKMFTTFF